MTGGATRGAGGGALGRHLDDVKGLNEATWPGTSRGLVSEGIQEQVAELTALASHARSRRPLYHVHADPSHSWIDQQWQAYWVRFETEFGLARQPFAETIHLKKGREHRHRVYSLVRLDGTCIRLDHDYSRREKIHRLVELETGERLTPGRHNRAVMAALDAEGHADAAAILRQAGLGEMERPEAAMSPRQRAQAERTGIPRSDVAIAAVAAWHASDNGSSFVAALADRGLILAQGHSVPVLIDASGNVHPLARALGKISKEAGERITAALVAARLAGLMLPLHNPNAVATVAPRRRADTALQPTASPDIVAAAMPSLSSESRPSLAAAATPAPSHRAVTLPSEAPTPQGDTGGGDFVAPIDPAKPDDWRRFLREWAAAERKKTTKIAALVAELQRHLQRQGDQHGSAIADQELSELIEHLISIRDQPASFRRGAGAAAALDGPDDRGSYRGHDQRHADPGAAALRRQPGHDPGDVCHTADSDTDRPSHPAAGASRAAADGGADAARPDRHAPGADRRQSAPAGTSDARRRVDTRRASRHLAITVGQHQHRLAKLTAALSQSSAIEARTIEALAASERRVDAILATKPWQDRASRDVDRIYSDLHDKISKRQRIRQAAAEQALQQFEIARSRIRRSDRLARAMGIRTEALQDAVAAETRAIQADAAYVAGQNGLGDEFSHAREIAAAIVRSREEERRRWERQPDIVATRREAQGNQLVRDACASGDRQIAMLAARDLNAARALLLQGDVKIQHRPTSQHAGTTTLISRDDRALPSGQILEMPDRQHLLHPRR